MKGDIFIPTGTNIDREHADTIVDKFGRAVFNFEIEVTDSVFSNIGYFSDEAEVCTSIACNYYYGYACLMVGYTWHSLTD